MIFVLFTLFGLIIYPYMFFCLNNFFWWMCIFYMIFFVFYMFFCFYEFFFSFNSVYMDFGFDSISLLLFVLTLWIVFLMIFSSSSFYNFNSYNFLFLCLLICFFLLMCFVSLNFFMFYFFFESVLIPTFILILGWGYQPERLQSSLYLVFYTMFSSLPLFMSIFYLYKFFYSLSFIYFDYLFFFNLYNDWFILIWGLFTIFSFFVKLPVYFFHLWLPKAHVEAPLSGSMILAGILLKLGGYGLYRAFIIFKYTYFIYGYYFLGFFIFGSIVSAIICLSQVDLKMLVAYSSVVHMGLIVSSLFSFQLISLNGCIIMMIGHGLCSSCMFALVNLIYERIFTRSSLFMKGFIIVFPGLMVWWFMISISNLSAPPSMNLIGELFLYMSLVVYSNLMILVLFIFFFFCSCYGIYFFYSCYHGKMNNFYSFNMINIREYMILLFHWLPLNLYILKCELFFF